MKAKKVIEILLEFERGLGSKQSLNIGIEARVKKWVNDLEKESGEMWGFPELHLNYDLSITLSPPSHGSSDNMVFLSSISPLPNFVKIKKVTGDLNISHMNDFDMEWMPEIIEGNLYFFENNIKLTKNELSNITLVHGKIYFRPKMSAAYLKKRAGYNKKWKRRGKVSTRDIQGLKKSYGYKTYKTLEFIKSFGVEGAKSKDILDFYYGIDHPRASRPPGWGTGLLSDYNKGPLWKRTDKIRRGLFAINSEGEDYLKNNLHFKGI